MYDLDVFIPTLKQRTNGLVCQAHTIFNSNMKVRLTVSLPDENYPEFMDKLTEEERKHVRFIPNIPQGSPAIPIKHCLESAEWPDWVLVMSDDDIILPWGLQHLWEARKDVSMVIGQTLGVSRKEHLDFTAWKIGSDIVACHVSTAMIHMRSLETLSKPWVELSPLCDFFTIGLMARNFPYRITPNVIHVQAFAEFENLGSEFLENYQKIYGHLL